MVINKLVLTAHAIRSCWYQKDLSVKSVTRYLDTFEYLVESTEISRSVLYHAGMRISNKNNGWRQSPVTINSMTLLPARFIARQIDLLMEDQYNLTPEEFFVAFEEIHPFNDGNGRVGEILYYRLTGSFAVPSFN